MNRIYARLIPALALAIVAGPLFAQGFRGNRAPGPMMLLTNKGVIEELKLSEEQNDKIKAATKEVTTKFTDDLKDAGKDRDKRAEITKKMIAEFNKKIDGTLKPEQTKRFDQLQVQFALRAGPAGLLSENLAKELKLTDKQKDAIKESSEALAKERQELRKDKDNFQENQKKIQAKTKEATDKLVETLSDDQKKALKEASGAAFEFKFEGPGGGGKGKKKTDL